MKPGEALQPSKVVFFTLYPQNSTVFLVFLLSEAIAIAVFFSDPYKLATSYVETMANVFEQYNSNKDIENMWHSIMLVGIPKAPKFCVLSYFILRWL